MQSQSAESGQRLLLNGNDLAGDEEEADDSDALFPVQYPDIDVLIMSEAGKPIYCYSDRADHTTLMSVCVALLNFVLKTQNDNLRSIHTRTGLHINFAHRSPLVIVVVCRQHSCFDEQTLINQIHAQIITTTTLQMLKSIFQKAPTYDMKRGINTNEYRRMNILVQSISSPIADLFTTYCDYLRANYARRSKLKSRLFNNVISFYTSTSISGPSLTLPGPVSPQASSPSSSQSSSSSPLVVLHEHRSNVLSRVYVPIAIIPSTVREQIAGIIKDAVANYSDIVFSILFTIVDEDADELDELGEQFEIVNRRNTTRSSCTSGQSMTMSGSEDEFLDAVEGMSLSGGGNSGGGGGGVGGAVPAAEGEESTQPTIKLKTLKLVTVGNHNAKLRISPLDIQLIYALIKASHSQLAISESLWIALCLSRIDPNRFLYAHISYLTEKYCLVLLDLDHEDFSQCRQAKETIQTKLTSIHLTEPLREIRSAISELGQHHLQYICHQTPRHCIMWQASTQTEFSPLNYYLIDRMQRSSLKTCWLRSSREQVALLGWHSTTFQLYAQFDVTVSQYEALDTVQSFIKWFKKEEDKLIIKDG